jgi:CRISPR-associated protein (TIGR02710 family)
MPQQQNIKALLIALEQNAQEAVFIINHYRPEYLLFFGSDRARSLIEQTIQPQIQQMPKRWDYIVTPDAASFPECYRAIAKQLHELLRTWQIQPGELVVDYTDGTQSMVMAIALASMDHCTRFIFAKSGETPTLIESNPWDQKAADESKQAAYQFNQGRYALSRMIFSRLQERVSGGSKPLYKAFSDLADGYDLWDGFKHQKALEKLKGAKKALELSSVFGGPAGIKPILAAVGDNLLFLEKVMMAQRHPDRTIFLDLLANAQRRAQLYHHYEEGMVRLYRALEVLAQIELEKKYGINPQDVRLEQIPENVREDFRRCLTSELDGKIKLTLYAAYQLLKAIGNPLGQSFFSLWPQIKLVLDVRHHSILAHGFEPIAPERYKELWDLILKLSETRPEALPRFPQLDL